VSDVAERLVLVDQGPPVDATTLLGALSSLGFRIGIVTRLEQGRPLPVLVRELTTLEHLAGGDLQVVVDIKGCDAATAIEAIEILRAMSTNEVTSVHGEHWNLTEAPNRPQPLSGCFNLSLLASEDRVSLDEVSQATGLEVIDPALGQGPGGEQWHFMHAEAALQLLHAERGLAEQ